MFQLLEDTITREPWNKGKLVGQKRPLKLQEIWAIRIRLQLGGKLRELALFNLAIDSKLRGCDLVRVKVADVRQTSGRVASRAVIIFYFVHAQCSGISVDATEGRLPKTLPTTCVRGACVTSRDIPLAPIQTSPC